MVWQSFLDKMNLEEGHKRAGLFWWLSGKGFFCSAADVDLILSWEDPLEKMADHSSILAWIILWTEEHGRLHTGHRVARVRHS